MYFNKQEEASFLAARNKTDLSFLFVSLAPTRESYSVPPSGRNFPRSPGTAIQSAEGLLFLLIPTYRYPLPDSILNPTTVPLGFTQELSSQPFCLCPVQVAGGAISRPSSDHVTPLLDPRRHLGSALAD